MWAKLFCRGEKKSKVSLDIATTVTADTDACFFLHPPYICSFKKPVSRDFWPCFPKIYSSGLVKGLKENFLGTFCVMLFFGNWAVLALNIFTPRTGFELLCMKPAAVTNQNYWIKNVQYLAQNLFLGVEILTYKINIHTFSLGSKICRTKRQKSQTFYLQVKM